MLLFAVFALGQESADVLFQRGLTLAKSGKLHEAGEVFRQGFRLYPADSRFPIELAGVAYKQQDRRAAESWLRRGLKIAPSGRYANEFLGTVFQLDGNLPAALKYLNRVGQPFLGQLTFQPDPGLSPELRDRLFPFSAGQLLTSARLQIAQGNLARTHLLTSLRIDLLHGASGYDAVVRSQPIALPLSGWIGRLLATVRDLPYEGIDLDFYNIYERGANFTSLWRWDPHKRRAVLTYASPLHGNPRIQQSYWLDVRDESWALRSGHLGLKRGRAGLEFAVGLRPRLQWTVGGEVDYREFADRPDATDLFRDGLLALIKNRFDYALWQIPEERFDMAAWGELDAGRYTSRLAELRAGLTLEWFPERSGDRYHLAVQSQAGRIFGNAPFDELFLLGMDRDADQNLWLRGLSDYADGRKGNGLAGSEYSITQTTLERRFFHIPLLNVSAGPFFDVGWTGRSPAVSLNRGLQETTGLQARLKTIGGVTLTAIYGRDITTGTGAFFTAVGR